MFWVYLSVYYKLQELKLGNITQILQCYLTIVNNGFSCTPNWGPPNCLMLKHHIKVVFAIFIHLAPYFP